MYALNLNKENGRILSVTFEKFASPDMPKVSTIPDGNIYDYRYVDGEYVYDPLPPTEEPLSEPTTDEILNVLLGVGGEL